MNKKSPPPVLSPASKQLADELERQRKGIPPFGSPERECKQLNDLNDWLQQLPNAVPQGVWTMLTVRLSLTVEDVMRFAAVALVHGVSVEVAVKRVMDNERVLSAICESINEEMNDLSSKHSSLRPDPDLSRN